MTSAHVERLRQRVYLVQRRYMDEGRWITDGWEVTGSLAQAWEAASTAARELDEQYAGSHFWNVRLRNAAGEDMVELFHGRLS